MSDHTSIHLRMRHAVAGILLAILVSGCEDRTGPAPRPDPGGGSGSAIVSDPTTSAAAPTTASVAYVSLRPGSFPIGERATVSNRRTGASLTVDLLAGGLDPVPVPADAGDTLTFAIDTGGAESLVFTQPVPLASLPTVVRTEPAVGNLNVPHDVQVRVIFSEPLSPTTVTHVTLGLTQPASPANGSVALSTDGLIATFLPENPLLPRTKYTIQVRKGIRDTDGSNLGARVTADFTTAAAAPTVFIDGNWQFSLTSTVAGMPSPTIAGTLLQMGTVIRGAMHIEGSNCFDRLTTIDLTGAATPGTLALTSRAVQGQVITLTGSNNGSSVTGTYAITGGCADGDQGTISGIKVARLSAGIWRFVLNINDMHRSGLATLTQGQASPSGSFDLSGHLNDLNDRYHSPPPPCGLGRIIPGTFPDPSYIMGTSVALKVAANGGTMVFTGTLSSRGILGDFRIVGGACDGVWGWACLLPGTGLCTPPGFVVEPTGSRRRLGHGIEEGGTP